MKGLHLTLLSALVCFAVESQAQTELPKSQSWRSLDEGVKAKYSIERHIPGRDSSTSLNVNSRLNRNLSKNRIRVISQESSSEFIQEKIPANPRGIMNYIDLNGKLFFKPKSSLGLML